MGRFSDIASRFEDTNPMKGVFELLDTRQAEAGVADGGAALGFTANDIRTIKDASYQAVLDGYALDGMSYATLDDARKQVTYDTRALYHHGVGDGYFNQVTGIGTAIDPGSYNTASIPVSMGPQEATAIYSSGGIAQVIIDKKAKGMFVNGYQFVAKDWKDEDLERLKDYSGQLNFEKALRSGAIESLLYGGSIVVPAFKRDTPVSYLKSVDELVKAGVLEKDSLDYFWTADRWNTVLIPDYNISAKSYITPDSMFVPITGLEIKRERMAMLRLKQLPYWGTLRQMGWGISDLEAYMRSLLQYETMMASIGIMSQQLSLLYRVIPLDGIIAQNGPKYAEEFAKSSSVIMKQMSNLNPISMNSIGEIKTVERHYTDFDKLVQLARQDIGAKAGISDTIIFNSQATGFSDNTEDTTLKQAETIKLLANELAVQAQPLVKILIYSCFGPDSPQAKKADEVRLSFESPTVMTNEEKTASLSVLGNWIGQATTAGIQIGDAITLARQFMPEFEVPKEIDERLSAFEDAEQADEAEELGTTREGSDGLGDADWNEEDHPRADNGQFGSGGGGKEEKEERKARKIPSYEESVKIAETLADKLEKSGWKIEKKVIGYTTSAGTSSYIDVEKNGYRTSVRASDHSVGTARFMEHSHFIVGSDNPDDFVKELDGEIERSKKAREEKKEAEKKASEEREKRAEREKESENMFKDAKTVKELFDLAKEDRISRSAARRKAEELGLKNEWIAKSKDLPKIQDSWFGRLFKGGK